MFVSSFPFSAVIVNNTQYSISIAPVESEDTEVLLVGHWEENAAAPISERLLMGCQCRAAVSLLVIDVCSIP